MQYAEIRLFTQLVLTFEHNGKQVNASKKQMKKNKANNNECSSLTIGSPQSVSIKAGKTFLCLPWPWSVNPK